VTILNLLLSHRSLLSPLDISLPWRPLYALFLDLSSHEVKLNLRVYPPDFDKALTLLVKRARLYFPPAATEEILATLRPQFCPHDPVMSRALSHCALFLPTLRVGVGAGGEWVRVGEPPPWRSELMLFWRACYNSPAWEESLMSLLARFGAHVL
jgi:hypothetical protein